MDDEENIVDPIAEQEKPCWTFDDIIVVDQGEMVVSISSNESLSARGQTLLLKANWSISKTRSSSLR